jgi:ATP-binding cassette, subfamily B, bacterial
MSGIYRPTSGLILLDGLDRDTLGNSGWRHRAAVAPQFHENYIIKGPLALNMLMGRDWPPRENDLLEAYHIGLALGLETLLERMPGGIMQCVGEGGWQLSHGEKSRVYLARALLQNAELLILDESFAALDPLTLQGALEAVLHKERTLIIIEHL